MDDVLALLEGRVSAEERVAFATHLDVCATCRLVVAESARSDGDDDEIAPSQKAPAGPLVRGTGVDRYIIIDWLGRGGMGVVYAAYDPKLDRRVALKLVHTAGGLETTTRAERNLAQSRNELLLSEARSMAQIVHPNVVTVYDVGTFGEEIFVAMEEVRGGTLAEWLVKEPRSIDEIVAVFLAAGRGLAAAHAAGIVHRDFKPQNVLFGERGVVKVSDFGLARPMDETDDAEPLAGTRAYMAPEIMAKGGASPRADQWSYCTSFRKALEEAAPGGDARAVPAHVRRVLARGLSNDPADRFATMDALLAALSNNPRARVRRALFAGLAVVAVIAALLTVRQTAHGHRAPSCTGGADRIGAVLGDPALAKIHAAFTAHGGSSAEVSFVSTEAALRAYAQKWAAMHDDACRATHERGEQSGELLDLRMQCLADAERSLSSLVGLLQVADENAVKRAVGAVGHLPLIASCADVVALRETVKCPTDPARKAAIDEIGANVARARGLHDLGKLREAVTLGRANVDAASKVEYPPLLAKALFGLGNSLLHSADHNAAEEVLYRAVAAADAGHDDKMKASALSHLVFLLGHWRLRFEDSIRLAAMADAAIVRAGGDEAARAELEIMLAVARDKHGDHDAARADALRSVERRERIFGAESLEVARSLDILASVDRSRNDHASVHESRVRALRIRERLLGVDAPGLSHDYNNMADCLRNLGRLEEALSFARKAVRASVIELGPEHTNTVISEVTVAQILTDQGKYAEAFPLMEHAWSGLRPAIASNKAQMAELIHARSAVLRGLGRIAEARALETTAGQLERDAKAQH